MGAGPVSAQYRLILIAVAICAAIFGVKTWEGHLIAKGDAQGASRVQAAWDRQEAERTTATAADNVAKFRNAERVTHETAQRETERQARDAAAATAVRGLRDQVARLNARPDPYPAGDAGLAACAVEATTARELFGESAGAYAQLAAEADGLRDQVVGLQDFVHRVIGAPAMQGASD
ncbi:hypothetical protein ASE28_28235 [Acidovorax sp. Root219]|nr:hypothetical protein ASE28_28235 [Acidovorax sp. Root219]